MVMAAVAIGCGPFAEGRAECPARFDKVAWLEARADVTEGKLQELAGDVVRCRFIRHGDTKADVARVLGRAPRDELQTRGEYEWQWQYYVGLTNDTMGPGDAQHLLVDFSGDGHVVGVSIVP